MRLCTQPSNKIQKINIISNEKFLWHIDEKQNIFFKRIVISYNKKFKIKKRR